jgi:hypothetical protein
MGGAVIFSSSPDSARLELHKKQSAAGRFTEKGRRHNAGNQRLFILGIDELERQGRERTTG